MSSRSVAVAVGGGVAAFVVAVPLFLVGTGGAVSVLFGGNDGPCVAAPAVPGNATFTSEQMTIARDAIALADQRGLPRQAKRVILVTGFQESGIRNLDYGDRDSVGWLQQRSGWGSIAQRLDPTYAASKFFDALVKIPGWQSMALTVAAQAVQISAFPDAYAQWETKADQLLLLLGDAPAACNGTSTGDVGGGPIPKDFDKQGNPRTAEQAVTWMVGQSQHRTTTEPVYGACERWMNLAYGLGGGYPTAIAHWNAPGPKSTTGTPPRGALIYIWSPNPARHVALSLGNSQAISTDFDGTKYAPGQLGVGSVDQIVHAFGGHLLGWRAPNFSANSGA